MFSMLSGVRLFNKLSFRSATASSVCQKYSGSRCKVSQTQFVGYVESSSIKYCITRKYIKCHIAKRLFSSKIDGNESYERELDPVEFEKISEATLDSLTEYFDELVDQAGHLQDADVSYGDGVLTIKFGEEHGTYVINRQTPNKQIWLSSPKSGPKRYNFVAGHWIYKHDGKSLHRLLDDEIPTVVKRETAFHECLYSGSKD